ncbi:MAG: hypothetical protein RR354_05375 [Mucinivorans sp.]
MSGVADTLKRSVRWWGGGLPQMCLAQGIESSLGFRRGGARSLPMAQLPRDQ